MTALTVLMHGRSFGSSDQHWGEKQIWEKIYNDSFEELYRKIVFKCWVMQIKFALYNFMICASDKQETNKKLFQRQNYKASSWRFEPNVKIVKRHSSLKSSSDFSLTLTTRLESSSFSEILQRLGRNPSHVTSSEKLSLLSSE